jgi:hypothetical protein
MYRIDLEFGKLPSINYFCFMKGAKIFKDNWTGLIVDINDISDSLMKDVWVKLNRQIKLNSFTSDDGWDDKLSSCKLLLPIRSNDDGSPLAYDRISIFGEIINRGGIRVKFTSNYQVEKFRVILHNVGVKIDITSAGAINNINKLDNYSFIQTSENYILPILSWELDFILRSSERLGDGMLIHKQGIVLMFIANEYSSVSDSFFVSNDTVAIEVRNMFTKVRNRKKIKHLRYYHFYANTRNIFMYLPCSYGHKALVLYALDAYLILLLTHMDCLVYDVDKIFCQTYMNPPVAYTELDPKTFEIC